VVPEIVSKILSSFGIVVSKWRSLTKREEERH
jgi:hypothetical protein